MNGWILYKNPIEESWETQKLVEEFEKQDVKIRVVNPNDVDIFVDRDDRKSIIVGGKPRWLPDFVIPRTGSGTTYFIKAIIRHLERLGVTLINGSHAIDTVKDKLYTQQILAESNLPVPKTLLLKHPINLDWVEKHLNFPVIIKTLSGSFGAGVFMAENKKQLWIPVGFAHGFLTISDHAEVNYKATGFWNKDCEQSISWNDKDLKITWPKNELGFEPIINEKDASAPFFKDTIMKGKTF